MTSSVSVQEKLLDFIFGSNYVAGICRRHGMNSDDCDEIRQRAAIRVFEICQRRRQLEVTNVKAFVAGISQRIIGEVKRQQRKCGTVTLAADVANSIPDSEEADDDELRDYLLNRLKGKERNLAELLTTSSSISDVAGALSLSLVNAHQCKSRLLKNVKRILSSSDDD
jgi:hypothetical protein